MTTNPGLTEQEREKIRLEEELRHDIRLKQRGSFWWINSPIVIWLLSAFVAGLIPFGYSEFQKRAEMAKEERQERQKSIESILSEVEFRRIQFNKILAPMQEIRQEANLIPDEQLTQIISDNRLSETGMKLKSLFSSAPRLRVVSELGGIYSIPRTDENASVWIGGSGWSNSHLPDGRGYRDEKYVNDSLFSLWKRYMTITSERSPSNNELSEVKTSFDNLKRATEPTATIQTLPTISSNALTMREWSEKVDLEAIKELRASTIKWIESVESAWRSIEALFPDSI